MVGQNIGANSIRHGDLAGEVALEQRAHPARPTWRRRTGCLPSAVRQALVDVAAAARDTAAFHFAMKLGMMPKRAPISLAPVLNRIARSACSSASPNSDRRPRRRPGRSRCAGPRSARRRRAISSISAFMNSRLLVHAQQRVAEHARRDRRRVDAALGGPGLRRLEEVEPLEFHAAHRREAELLGARQHALQRLARADRRAALLAVARSTNSPRKNGTLSSHGTRALRAEVEPRERVGKAVLPAGERACCRSTGRSTSQPNTTSQKPKPPPAPARRRRGTCRCAGTCRAGRRRCR